MWGRVKSRRACKWSCHQWEPHMEVTGRHHRKFSRPWRYIVSCTHQRIRKYDSLISIHGYLWVGRSWRDTLLYKQREDKWSQGCSNLGPRSHPRKDSYSRVGILHSQRVWSGPYTIRGCRHRPSGVLQARSAWVVRQRCFKPIYKAPSCLFL